MKYMEASPDINSYSSSEDVRYRHGKRTSSTRGSSYRLSTELSALATDKEFNDVIEKSFKSNFLCLQEKKRSTCSDQPVSETVRTFPG